MPPVVRMRLERDAAERNADVSRSSSSGTVMASMILAPAAFRMRTIAGPERSFWVPAKQRSLTVRTMAEWPARGAVDDICQE